MPWDIRSEAAKERIIAFGIVLVLALVAVLGVLTFVGMEFITNVFPHLLREVRAPSGTVH
jgi:hypothetical protein